MKDNCIQLSNVIVHELQLQEWVPLELQKHPRKEVPGLMYPKKIAPQILDQSEGDKVCGQDWIDKLIKDNRIDEIIEMISSQHVSV